MRLSYSLLLVLLAAMMASPSIAQGVIDCPNTVRMTIGCEGYLPTAPDVSHPQYGESVSFGGGHNVLYAPSEADDPAYRGAVAAELGGTVDYFDATAGTPDVPTMQTYDAVYTWTNFAYADPVGFGDNLAAYVDAGGIVILGVFTSFDSGNSLQGAIRGPDYSPVANPTGSNHFLTDSWAGDGAFFYSGVASLECFFRDILVPQGTGAVDGTYLDSEILGAYRSDFKVMYMNGEGHAALGCTSDWHILAANMVQQGRIPVELVAFYATTDGGTVRLAWETASETNNAGFEVQALADGGWSVLGFVEGHGTTTEAQTYRFDVGSLEPGSYRYRLKQIDFDGSFEYSPEVEATVETPGTHVLSNVYPNPFNPTASFTLSVARDQVVDVALFDALGQRVATLFEGVLNANEAKTFAIEGSTLSTGVYLVRATGETFSAARPVTLVR